MKKFQALFLLPGLLLAMSACNNAGLKKTKSGILYKIISDEKNPLVKPGDFVKINFIQKVRDSILFSSEASNMPGYIRVDTAAKGAYSPLEIFPMLRKGDSAVVIQIADSLQRRTGQPLPPFLKKKDKLILALRVTDVFTSEEAMKADREKYMSAAHDKQSREVEEYLTRNNIKTTKTEKGTFVMIDSVGSGTVPIDSGKQVSVLYTGKLFPTMKVFESNMEDTAKGPIKFVVGRRQIIAGWDDGLRLFRKGGKGTLYIPSFLAYDQQPGPGKKPNENLVFDIKIVDVTDAPAEQPRGMRPGGMPPPHMPMPMPVRPKK